jgi:hypothetical protein
MRTIKDYIVFSSLNRYRPSPLSQYQAKALSIVALAFVRIIFGLYLHVTPAFVLSFQRCFFLEDLRWRRRPPTKWKDEIISIEIRRVRRTSAMNGTRTALHSTLMMKDLSPLPSTSLLSSPTSDTDASWLRKIR